MIQQAIMSLYKRDALKMWQLLNDAGNGEAFDDDGCEVIWSGRDVSAWVTAEGRALLVCDANGAWAQDITEELFARNNPIPHIAARAEKMARNARVISGADLVERIEEKDFEGALSLLECENERYCYDLKAILTVLQKAHHASESMPKWLYAAVERDLEQLDADSTFDAVSAIDNDDSTWTVAHATCSATYSATYTEMSPNNWVIRGAL